jgi:hypothetical protein
MPNTSLKIKALEIQGKGDKKKNLGECIYIIEKGPFYVRSNLRRRVRVRRISFLYFFFFIRSLR